MNAAAPVTRPTTQGWAKVPHSIIENQACLTRAELALLLIAVRRDDVPRQISDEHWKNWTGLSPRQKEYAIAGLKQKGGLVVAGQGNTARYSFDRDRWERYLRTPGHQERPRTVGRPVDPKPGAKIHPACRERGCALLLQESGGTQSGLSPSGASQVAQPVAQISAERPSCTSIPVPPSKKQLTLVPTSSIAQPVAQSSAVGQIVESAWVKTLAALHAAFPVVGLAFLVHLVTVVCRVFAGVQDDELSAAVLMAWNASKTRQKSPGLFLVTVPEALAVIRRKPKPRASPDLSGEAQRRLKGLADKLRARGAPWAEIARDVAAVRIDEQTDYNAIDAQLSKLEAVAVRTGWDSLPVKRRHEIERAVADELKPWSAKMFMGDLLRLETQFRDRRTLEAVELPPFSLFYE